MIPQRLHSREIIFTAEDAAAYCDLLVAKEPSIRFLRELTAPEDLAKTKPSVGPVAHIRQAGGTRVEMFFPYPGWDADWELNDRGNGWTRASSSQTWPNGYWWNPSSGPLENSRKLPDGRVIRYLGDGIIVFRARYSHPEELRRVDALLRLVSKVATRKGLQRFVITTPEEPPHIFTSGRLYWAGHHAIAWARHSPDRYLACRILGDGRVLGWRPLD